MGCSSSTQTHTQGNKRPATKVVESNGAKKCAPSDESDPILVESDPASDESDTIPDQTKLEPMKETESDEATEFESLQADKPDISAPEAISALEDNDSSRSWASPPPEDTEPTATAVEEEHSSPPVESASHMQSYEEEPPNEGETGGKVEAEMPREIASETKYEGTGDAVDAAAATEIEAANNEE